jgi:hypothetical protein
MIQLPNISRRLQRRQSATHTSQILPGCSRALSSPILRLTHLSWYTGRAMRHLPNRSPKLCKIQEHSQTAGASRDWGGEWEPPLSSTHNNHHLLRLEPSKDCQKPKGNQYWLSTQSPPLPCFIGPRNGPERPMFPHPTSSRSGQNSACHPQMAAFATHLSVCDPSIPTLARLLPPFQTRVLSSSWAKSHQASPSPTSSCGLCETERNV